MQWPSFDMKSAILPQILKLEDSFREYEKIASTLAEEIRFAVLMKCLGGQLKTYLQVSLQDSTTYDELREAAIRYDQSTIRWTNAMALGSAVASPADTAIPMDVDRIEKGGKGKKGKSKSAGKDKNKGKQKSKQGDKGYHSGKGYGNQQQTSWSSKGSSWQNSSWHNNSDGFGKGGKSQKGNKGKDSGKSKDVTCHKCGGQGHYARDCRVRAVGQSDNGANATDGKADNTGKGNSTGSAQVNRVSFAPDVSAATVYREFNFDISGSDNFRDFSSFHVNMISKHNKPETKPTVLDEFVLCRHVRVMNNSFSMHAQIFQLVVIFAVAVERMSLQSVVQLVTVMLSSTICNDCFSLTTWSTTLSVFGMIFNLVCMMLQNLINVTNIS